MRTSLSGAYILIITLVNHTQDDSFVYLPGCSRSEFLSFEERQASILMYHPQTQKNCLKHDRDERVGLEIRNFWLAHWSKLQ